MTLELLYIFKCLFHLVGEMIFQIVDQIDLQDLLLARNVDQGSEGEIKVQSQKAGQIKRSDL